MFGCLLLSSVKPLFKLFTVYTIIISDRKPSNIMQLEICVFTTHRNSLVVYAKEETNYFVFFPPRHCLVNHTA